MKTASVRQLRTSFPKIERWIAAGETVSITKRRKIVAELSLPRATKKPDFAKRFGLPANYKARPGRSAVDLLLEERGSEDDKVVRRGRTLRDLLDEDRGP